MGANMLARTEWEGWQAGGEQRKLKWHERTWTWIAKLRLAHLAVGTCLLVIDFFGDWVQYMFLGG